MTRRIIDSLIEDKITFVLEGSDIEKNAYIEDVLTAYDFHFNIYNYIIYDYLYREIMIEHDNPNIPIVYIEGKFIGGVEELNAHLGIYNGIIHDSI